MTAKITNRWIMILITACLMMLTLLDWKLSPVRVLFAVALVTILPGYTLTSAIFVNTPLGILEKIAFSFGFSLGITSLGGLFLNYIGWGIQPISWVVLLGGISLVANVIALMRMKDESQVDLELVEVPLRAHEILFMVLAAGILSLAFLFARAGAETRVLQPTTQVWVLWTDDARTQLKVGLKNQENIPMQYRVQLTTLQGEVHTWPVIQLDPGATWEVQYAMPNNVAESDFIKATLYRLDQPERSYREVYLRRVLR